MILSRLGQTGTQFRARFKHIFATGYSDKVGLDVIDALTTNNFSSTTLLIIQACHHHIFRGIILQIKI